MYFCKEDFAWFVAQQQCPPPVPLGKIVNNAKYTETVLGMQ